MRIRAAQLLYEATNMFKLMELSGSMQSCSPQKSLDFWYCVSSCFQALPIDYFTCTFSLLVWPACAIWCELWYAKQFSNLCSIIFRWFWQLMEWCPAGASGYNFFYQWGTVHKVCRSQNWTNLIFSNNSQCMQAFLSAYRSMLVLSCASLYVGAIAAATALYVFFPVSNKCHESFIITPHWSCRWLWQSCPSPRVEGQTVDFWHPL